MASTSYLSSLLMTSGGGEEKVEPYGSVDWYKDKREVWNTSCILHVEGSWSL